MPPDSHSSTGKCAVLRGEKLTEDAPEEKWSLRIRALFVMTVSLILLVITGLETSRSHELTANENTATAQLGAISEQFRDTPKEISRTSDPKLSNEPVAGPQTVGLDESREVDSEKFSVGVKESIKSDEPNILLPSTDPKLQIRVLAHLASLRTEQQARREWARLKLEFPTHLENLNLIIKRVDLGTQGTFYRVLAEFAQDRSSASRLCDSLRAVNQYCSAVKSETFTGA